MSNQLFLSKRNDDGSVTCSFCRKSHSPEDCGEWHGVRIITCCHRCATEALPKLAADSIRINENEALHISLGELVKIIGAYWYALRIRLRKSKINIKKIKEERL